MKPKLSDCQPLMIATVCVFLAGPTLVLPEYGIIFGLLAALPIASLLWLAVALWRRFNPPQPQQAPRQRWL